MPGEFHSRSVVVDGEDRKFSVYVPSSAESPPAAILFLHGRGESGVDGEAQTRIGLGASIRTEPDRWPFLVVFPQKPDADGMWPSFRNLVNAALQSVDAEFETDRTRRYLTGLSQGGNGALELSDQLHWRFAAMAPICGWANPWASAAKIAVTPTWIFHGDGDDVVPPSSTRAIVDWCARDGVSVTSTFYPGVGHNSWDLAYAEPLPMWFLERSLP